MYLKMRKELTKTFMMMMRSYRKKTHLKTNHFYSCFIHSMSSKQEFQRKMSIKIFIGLIQDWHYNVLLQIVYIFVIFTNSKLWSRQRDTIFQEGEKINDINVL